MPVEILIHNECAWDSQAHPTCAEIRVDGQLVAVITASLTLDTGADGGGYHVTRLKVTNLAPESVGVTGA